MNLSRISIIEGQSRAEVHQGRIYRPEAFFQVDDSEPGKADSRRWHSVVLVRIAAELPADEVVFIFGFGDAVGTDSRNDTIGWSRALAVAGYLRQMALPNEFYWFTLGPMPFRNSFYDLFNGVIDVSLLVGVFA